MTYRFQDRLRHSSNRMAEVNNACGTYIRGTAQRPMDFSPILISADELGPGGDPSLVLVQRQDFVLWRCDPGPDGKIGMGQLYPPQQGDKIIYEGDTYAVSSMGADEPPYVHTTSNRERLVVHSVRIGRET